MSMDYFLISPPHYTFNTYLDRLPPTIHWHDLGDNRFHIDAGKRGCWLCMWIYSENGFSSLEEAFTKAQMSVINTISNPLFFVLSGGNKEIMNPVMSIIANDPKIFINDDNNSRLLRGDMFVSMLNASQY